MAQHYGIPGIAGGLGLPQVHNLFRYGEQITSAKATFAAGSVLGDQKPGAWEWHMSYPCALDVRAVLWEVFAVGADLDRLLWSASLEWDFIHQQVPISHLNYSTGSIGDFFFPPDDGRSDLEKLADTIHELPAEEVWRALAQTNSLGQRLCYRGRKVYTKFPVALPSNTNCSIRLVLDEPVELQNEVRLRVGLDGYFKQVIEVG